MSTQLQTAFLIADVPQRAHSLRQRADSALKAAAGFWYVVAVLGQLAFAFAVASFYGLSAGRGHWQQWNKTMTHGYVSGQPVGNVVVAIHLVSAVIILISGAMQLVPQIQRGAPRLHRWNGRVYFVTAFTVSLAGLYMMWFRGTVGGFVQHLGQSLDAVMIMVFAVLALRYALARDFKTHRRWALRLFMVVSSSLFIRAGVFLWFAARGDASGLDPDGSFLTYMTFAQYLVPLAVLEVYLRIQRRGGTAARFAMAGGLLMVTLVMGAGIGVVTAGLFVPSIKRAFDRRTSISETLAATIAASGIDQAAKQYYAIKASSHGTYNLDEDELNVLGYQLIRTKQYKQAVRILALNVEAYPQSSNSFDSLGEAYMDDGDKPLAIANYRRSLELNPKNANGIKMLQKMNAHTQ